MDVLKKRFPPFVTPILLLCLTLSAVGMVGKQLVARNYQLLEKQFEFETQRVTSKVMVRVMSYTQLLRGASGFFAGSQDVSRKEWHDYVEKLDLDQNYKGLQGLGFSKLIPAQDLEKHVVQLRKAGFPDYVVKPEGKRDFYTSIIYLEPFSGRNLRAFGYDMFSEPIRHSAMEKARDTGATALSGKVMLLQETKTDVQAGTLAYHPVYKNGTLLQTVEQRQAALIGWVYSPYRMNDLMNAALEGDLTNVRLEIFDGKSPQIDALLYDSQSKSDSVENANFPYLTLEKTIEMEGRYWTLRYSAQPAFFGKEKYGSNWVELTGLSIIALLAFIIAWAFFNTRVRAEKIAKELTTSLRKNTEQLDIVMQSAQVAIFLADNTGHLAFVNLAALEILGYQHDELIGKSATILLENHEIIRAASYVEQGLQKGQIVDNWKLKTKLGKVILFELVVQLLSDGRLLATGNDITERYEAEMALRESEQRFRLMADYAPVFIWITDVHKMCTWFNKKWIDFTGGKLEEHLGFGWADLVHPDDIDVCVSRFDHHELFSIIYRLRRYDGEWRWILENGLPRFDENNRFLGYIGSGIDITEQKQYETELLVARESAERANTAKSEFLANMSHEIRTPMNAIIGLTQLALNTQLTTQQADYLDKILSSSQHLLAVLNDVLDLSKIEADKLTILHEAFDLDELIHNLDSLFHSRANEKKLEFKLQIDSDVPRHLMGDALRLQQVLINLLANALKFTQIGFAHLAVNCVKLNSQNVILKFTIIDSGIGIDQESQRALFQPFTQADNSITRRFGGTGLGLAISRKLVKLMGGEIHLISQMGQGSSFSFEISFDLAPNSTGNTRFNEHIKHLSSAEQITQLAKKLTGKRVLLVEDNPLNQQVASEFLRNAGLKVVIANDGQEALNILNVNEFDVVLMDIQMPVMDGLQATNLIRQQEKFANLPIIAMSAGVTLDEQEKCQHSGMNDFIAKPINPVAMLKTLTHIFKADIVEYTEIQTKTNTILSRYENLQGFDTQRLEMLEIMLGSQTKVLEMLMTFGQDFENCFDEINTQLDKNEIQAARTKLHSLKGCAGNIGALHLSKLASEIETELLNENVITNQLGLLKHAIQTVFNTIHSLNISKAHESSSIDFVTFKTQLLELEKLLRSNSFISESLLNEIEIMDLTPKKTTQRKQLLIAIHHFDYENALTLLHDLIAD